MAVLEKLEPGNVFRFFEELCSMPHGSGNTKIVSDWLARFAVERGLEHYQDELNNVIIIREASAGYEEAEPVILQGHMDMVCEKAPDCTKDMTREGLDLEVDGDTILARGTTLGGDDGVAVAMMLAVLDDDNMAHPRVECVFTVDEEVGMEGAEGLDVTPLKGRRMLNLDSEDEGVFTVSCAGGNLTTCTVPVHRSPYPFEGGTYLTIRVEGLLGGHSGAEIHKGRANANVLLGRILFNAAPNLRIVSVTGGLKDNAIPVSAAAVVCVKDPDFVRATCGGLEAAFRNEYAVPDPDIRVFVDDGGDGMPMDGPSTNHIITLLTCCPNGVYAMSPDIAGLVQTSLNLGILSTAEDHVTASFCIRSSIESQKEMLVEKICQLMTCMEGATVSVCGDYPGWQFRQKSPLRDLLTEVFTEQYGRAPVVEAIHAGVECGLFCGKLPGLDCVSVGPDMKDIHTFRERLHIASTQRLWTMVVEALRRMK
jgi:dipeptidase D